MTIPDVVSVMNGANYTPQEEKRIIKELNDEAESKLKEGNLYYVVSARWFIGWQRYTEQDVEDCEMNGSSLDLSNGVDRPGPIDNSELISNVIDSGVDNLELIRALEEGQDYVLVPEVVWKKLLGWYNGGPPLPRKLISQGAINKKFNVEVFPLSFKLTDSRDNSQLILSFSKKVLKARFYTYTYTGTHTQHTRSQSRFKIK